MSKLRIMLSHSHPVHGTTIKAFDRWNTLHKAFLLLHTMVNLGAFIAAFCALWPLILGAAILILLIAFIICKLLVVIFHYVAFPAMKLRYNADMLA